jgi:hypothetical protein
LVAHVRTTPCLINVYTAAPPLPPAALSIGYQSACVCRRCGKAKGLPCSTSRHCCGCPAMLHQPCTIPIPCQSPTYKTTSAGPSENTYARSHALLLPSSGLPATEVAGGNHPGHGHQVRQMLSHTR